MRFYKIILLLLLIIGVIYLVKASPEDVIYEGIGIYGNVSGGLVGGGASDGDGQISNSSLNIIYLNLSGTNANQDLNLSAWWITIFSINATNWDNVSITESQISDLSHTIDTDTNASECGIGEYLDGGGLCISFNDTVSTFGVAVGFNATDVTGEISNTTLDALYLNLSGTNADQNINITPYDLFVDIIQPQAFRTYPGSQFLYNFFDDGDNLILNVSNVSGNNYFGVETDGGFLQLYANPNPANDHLLFTVTETQGADTEINFYEGGTTHNRLWSSGSVRIGGSASRLCTEITNEVDCDTPVTGADLVLQDDMWLGGKIFSNGTDWSNVSIPADQVSNFNETAGNITHILSGWAIETDVSAVNTTTTLNAVIDNDLYFSNSARGITWIAGNFRMDEGSGDWVFGQIGGDNHLFFRDTQQQWDFLAPANFSNVDNILLDDASMNITTNATTISIRGLTSSIHIN